MKPNQFDLSSVMLELFDHALESIVVVDTEGRVLYANRITVVYGGKTLVEMMGNLLWDIFPESAGFYVENFRRAVREQVPVSIEFYFPPAEKWFEIRFYPSPNAVAVFSADLTERKKASEVVRTEQKRLQNTLNAANIGTWRWDFATDLYTADPLSMMFFDVKPEQIAPNDDSLYRERIHPDDLAQVDETLSRTAKFGEPYIHIYRVIHLDGSVHWLDGRGHLEYDSAGNATALIGMVMDVTTHKEAEEALRLSEEKYRLLIANVDQGYCLCELIWDTEGNPRDYRYLEVNASFETMSGLAEAAGKTILEMVPNFEVIFWAKHFDEVLKTGEPRHIQQASAAMGRVFDVFVAPRSKTQFVVLFTDITDKVRHQREMEVLNERLQRSMQETHHRVKNNLQVISSLVEMQADDVANDVTAVPLRRINQHVQALAVIHDLLTQQAKDDDGGDLSHLGTRSVLETLLPPLQNTIGQSITAEIEDIQLTAQKAAALALLVSELVSNAVKHGRGKIEITLKREDSTAHLEVCDDGTGFPANFDPRRAANTGLQLIESAARWDLRGDVHFDNHPKGGGRVVVTFPIEADAAPS